MISPRNILRHELIGLDVLVARASNPGHVGVAGRIIDETETPWSSGLSGGRNEYQSGSVYSASGSRMARSSMWTARASSPAGTADHDAHQIREDE